MTDLKFSDRTMKILHNWSQIHSGLVLREGRKQVTVSPQKNIVSLVALDETLPLQCGIYDVKRFATAVELFAEPTITFADKYVTVHEDNHAIRYIYCEPKLIDLEYQKRDPEKFKNTKSDVEFVLPVAEFNKLRKGMSLFALPEFIVQFDGTSLQCIMTDRENPSSNRVSYRVPATDTKWVTESHDFSLAFPQASIQKLLDGTYTVSLSIGAQLRGRFDETDTFGVTYILGAEAVKSPIVLKD